MTPQRRERTIQTMKYINNSQIEHRLETIVNAGAGQEITAIALAGLNAGRIADQLEEFNRMFNELATAWNQYGVPINHQT